MASLISGYEYDIFISYRQKDNKYDGWVSEFVDNLKRELEATFKEDVSVYFDNNPSDGLLETHDVDASLKEKLKCLIFIPIISRTYCDPKSFAWEHEFKEFVELAAQDQFGLKVKLPNGNVVGRVLPVRIYNLESTDIRLFESVLGGVLRSVDFTYKSSGVNRPLRSKEEKPQENLNNTLYRDQINKVANSIKEIIHGLRRDTVIGGEEKTHNQEPESGVKKVINKSVSVRPVRLSWLKITLSVLGIVVLTTVILLWPKSSAKEKYAGLNSEEILDKAIRICDPYNHWDNFYGKVHLIHVKLEGNIDADEIIEIQTRENFYRCTSVFSTGNRIVKGIKNGVYFREINGNGNPGEDQIKEHNLNSEWISYWKEFHYCHFGLLMNLKASGLVLDDKVKISKFNGVKCLTLDFTCDTAKIKFDSFKEIKNWTIYIDPVTYSIKGWGVDGVMGLKGYAVYTGNLRINGIDMPLIKTYYNSSDSTFLAIDVFTYAK
jgi:hypothetical protein